MVHVSVRELRPMHRLVYILQIQIAAKDSTC